MIDASFLKELSKFHLIVNKRVTSNYAGEKRSIAEGQGLVFKDHRIYAPGDDIRAIDWRVFARTDKLHVKRYEEERSLVTHIMIDSSASMDFGRSNKFDYAAMIGVGFAYLTMRENEKFQYATFSESLNSFRSKKGMNQLAAMIDHLNGTKHEGYSHLQEAMMKYKKLIRSKSLIVIISDFLLDVEEIKNTLYMFKGHEIKLIQVLDAAERDFNFKGDLKLKDSESKSILKTHISPRLKSQYQQRLEEHINKIHEICDSLGISYNLITTGMPIFDAFYTILK